MVRIQNGTVSLKSGKELHLSVLECDSCSFFYELWLFTYSNNELNINSQAFTAVVDREVVICFSGRRGGESVRSFCEPVNWLFNP